MPPLNLVGDFGGGGMFLAFGVACALLEAQKSGKGQVVDAAMVDGAAILMSMFHGFLATGMWNNERGTNLLDTGAHFYDTYECADGNYVSIGSIEPQFYAELLRITGSVRRSRVRQADGPRRVARAEGALARGLPDQDPRRVVRARWSTPMCASRRCLTIAEAAAHPHNVARSTFVEVGGISQPAPAPRFSRTEAELARPPSYVGQHSDEVLGDWLSLTADDVAKLHDSGAVR